VALGTIYGAERTVPVTFAQIAGVSYDNLGEAGLQFLSEMADGGGRARVLTTLLFAMKQRGAKNGMASLCLGGGNAVSMAVEAL